MLKRILKLPTWSSRFVKMSVNLVMLIIIVFFVAGDGAVQENDCEAQGYGLDFAVYGSDKHANARQKLLQSKRNFIYDRITLVVSDQTISWNNHRGESASLRDPSLFALAGQSDNQGDVNYDVYLGLNRVIDGDYRSGQGLCKVVATWLK